MKLVIYGKGGIGKSTTTSNLAVAFARRKKSVLQIGCDPKHDSTFPIAHSLIPTATEVLAEKDFNYDEVDKDDIIFTGYEGIACVEAGGPAAGVGCAGYVVGETIGLLSDLGALTAYDIILFDVLGDVVCGGFSVPLQHADYAVIVATNDFDSLFAANRIAAAVAQKGKSYPVKFAGMIANRCSKKDLIDALSARLDSKTIGLIEENSSIRTSRLGGKTIFEAAESDPALVALTMPYIEIADYLLSNPAAQETLPLSDREVFSLLTEIESAAK
ncbi:MAG: ferredoxin:protochlorophyllide reductase (ATP-dependent) iron-sulfur ATP-binding protein [Actinomycetota bacterium]|nr:ferredoxin:protochlorophyllide reductase (ATP-dependent) iron-sulfur ATP-binding protein [Actinomycetota bacterium]